MVNLLFEPKHFQTVELVGKSPKCETIENISKAVTIRLSCYEAGNTIDFLQAESIYTMTKDPMIFSLPISDILSTKDRTEKKGLVKNRF